MTIQSFGPADPGERLQDEVSRLLDHYRHSKQPARSMAARHWHPNVDVFESGDGYAIIADLAGMHEASVEVVSEGQALVLRGDRAAFGTRPDRRYHQIEIPAGAFERVVELPADADTDKAQAHYDNGFLEIVVPRRRPQERTIRITPR